MTGKGFEVVAHRPAHACTANPGSYVELVLLRDSSNVALPAAVSALSKKLRYSDEFVLHAASDGSLWIVATHPSGLRHGAYEYLDRLGVRWVMPEPDAFRNARWTIFPSRNDIRIEASIVSRPLLRTFTLAPEFGFGTGKFLRQGNTATREWNDWIRRNRFPSEYTVPRQIGAAFNTAHRKDLEANEAFRPVVAGHRQPWSAAMKWDYTSHGRCSSRGACDRSSALVVPGNDKNDYDSAGGVVGLFSHWARTEYQRSIARDPEGPDARLVSIEPTDGPSSPTPSANFHCDCTKCRNLLRKGRDLKKPIDRDSTISDRVFHFARHVAADIAENPPRYADGSKVTDPGVGLLAYYQHAPPPTIPLLPNMYVHVVAYGYSGQTTGVSPNDLLEAWAAKRNKENFHLGVSASWTVSRPELSPYRTADMLRFWERLGYEGVSASTTLASGETGLLYYVAARQLWNPNLDVRSTLDEVFQYAFGRAKAPIRRLFERWWQASLYEPNWEISPGASDFALTENEVQLSYRDIEEARRLLKAQHCPASSGGDAACAARIADVAGYVKYLGLRLDFENTVTDKETQAHDDASARLAAHLAATYDSNFTHAWRIFRRDLFNGTDCSAKQDVGRAVCELWHPYVGEAYGTAQQPPRGGTFHPDSRRIIEPVTFSTDRRPLAPPSATAELVKTDTYDRAHEFALVSSGEPLTIRLLASMDHLPTPQRLDGALRVRLRDAQAKEQDRWDLPFDRAYPANTTCGPTASQRWSCPHTLTVKVPPGQYVLNVFVPSSGQFYALEIPRSLPFALAGKQHAAFATGKQYFFVPKGTKRFALIARNSARSTLRFFAPNGAAIEAQKRGRDTYVVESSGKDGEIWSLSGLQADAVSYKLPYLAARFVNVPNLFAYSKEQVLVPADAKR